MKPRLYWCIFCLSFLGIPLYAGVAYAQLSSLVTQTPPLKGVSIVKMESIDAAKNVEITPTKESVIIQQDGVYFILTAAQVGATSLAAKGWLDIWLIKNGEGIPNTNTRMSVDGGSTTDVLVSQAVLSLKAGDKIATGYSASGSSLGLIFTQPDNEPAIPSIIFSLLKIDTGDKDDKNS